MRLPSGALITEQDLDFLQDLLKPQKNKVVSNGACWYCNNGHDRQHIDLGALSYDLCECGASISELAKKNGRKLPYAKLGAEFARAIGAPKRNPKAML